MKWRAPGSAWPVPGALLLASLLLAGCGSPDRPATVGPTDAIVPDETADALALARLTSWSDLPVFTPDRYRQYSSYDRETRPPTSSPLLQNGNRDMNNFVCRSDDAQMGNSFIEPVYDLPTCPEKYVHGLVLARADGPGRLTRFALTMSSLRNGPGDEILRLYVDDSPRPFIQVPLADALDGSAGEIFAPPFGRGSTENLAWYYPVSFKKRLVVALDRVGSLDLVYYQIDVAGNPAHAAAPAKRSSERDAAEALLSGTAWPKLDDLAPPASVTIAPGQTQPVATLSGPATIDEFSVTVARADLASLGQLMLSVTWDGASSPAIEAPLSFFYVSALSTPTEDSLALSSSSDAQSVTMTLRLPMPFATSAAISLSSTASAPLSIGVALRGRPGVPDKPFGHLHTEVHTTVGPTTLTHHPIVNAKGRGRHVGTCMMLEGHGLGGALSSPMNFLEGDFRGVIDGSLAIRGTGTEDYFDSAFYFEAGPFGFPFAQAWGIDASAGHVSACRWHILGDAIDYKKSFDLDVEIGPGDPALLDRYRSIAFDYQ